MQMSVEIAIGQSRVAAKIDKRKFARIGRRERPGEFHPMRLQQGQFLEEQGRDHRSARQST